MLLYKLCGTRCLICNLEYVVFAVEGAVCGSGAALILYIFAVFINKYGCIFVVVVSLVFNRRLKPSDGINLLGRMDFVIVV